MKKAVYFGILSVVTVVCMIIGITKHLSLYRGENRNHVKNEKSYGEEAELESFSKIEMDLSVANVKIMVGERYGISYRATDRLEPSYEVKEGILFVSQENGKNVNIIPSVSNKRCDIEITVPKKDALSAVKINNSVGDINLDQLVMDDVVIEQNVGDMDIQDVTFDNAQVSCNTGDVRLENAEIGSMLDVSNNIGDVSVSSVQVLDDYAMEIKTDIGNVEIEGEKQGKSYQKQGKDEKNIHVNNNCGDVKIFKMQ